MSNYRRITNLNIIGKFLERLATEQMRRHMEKLAYFGPLQSAYLALHSTDTAITRAMDDLLSSKASKSPCSASLDIRAAFDTLDHRCLLERLKVLIGFDITVLQWLGSYLVGWEQFSGVASCRYCTVKLFSSVQQGSVFGPLQFSTFTKPVGNLVSTFCIRYHEFAEDEQLYAVIDMTSTTGLATLSACADAVIDGTSEAI